MFDKILNIFKREGEGFEQYICWMCNARYQSPTEFLVHIKACEQKQK